MIRGLKNEGKKDGTNGWRLVKPKGGWFAGVESQSGRLRVVVEVRRDKLRMGWCRGLRTRGTNYELMEDLGTATR